MPSCMFFLISLMNFILHYGTVEKDTPLLLRLNPIETFKEKVEEKNVNACPKNVERSFRNEIDF